MSEDDVPAMTRRDNATCKPTKAPRTPKQRPAAMVEMSGAVH